MDIIRVPIGYVIQGCCWLVKNYALALLLFALIMKVLLFPLGIKQQKNMVKQAALKPKEEAIRRRYAGRTDKATQQKMQQEILQMQQKENFSPLSGCLPMLLQLVIVFALYNVVMNPLQYINHIPWTNLENTGKHIAVMYHDGDLKTETLPDSTVNAIKTMAEAVGEDGNTDNVKYSIPSGITLVNIIRENGVEPFQTEDMLGKDFTENDLPNFYLIGHTLDLSGTPSFQRFDWLLVIPVLTFVFTFGSMKLTRKFSYQPAAAGDAGLSMKIMDFVMPAMSTYFTFLVPAVVAVYWIYQNVLGTVQQYVLKKMYPYPTFTEEEIKAVEREMNKGIKPAKPVKKTGRAAHRIDLDDEEIPSVDAVDATKAIADPAPEKSEAGPSPIPPARLKDESDKPDRF